jgi:periplasmic copper chaperone A
MPYVGEGPKGGGAQTGACAIGRVLSLGYLCLRVQKKYPDRGSGTASADFFIDRVPAGRSTRTHVRLSGTRHQVLLSICANPIVLTTDQRGKPVIHRPLLFAVLFSFGAMSAVFAAGGVAAGGIDVRDAWSRSTPPGIEVGVAYLVIENHGAPDRLVSASSPIAKHTELHISKMEDGVMKMLPLDAVDIQPGAQTAFAPGGRHVMLIGLKQPLKDGDTFPLTLTFEHAGRLRTTVRVYGIGKTPPQH